MDDMSALLVVPVVSALVGALVAYLFTRRGARLERFTKLMVESHGKAIAPLYHRIRAIHLELHRPSLERDLVALFADTSGPSSQVYLIPNAWTLECYYYCTDCFRDYQDRRTPEAWDRFWKAFCDFSLRIEHLYWDNHVTIFLDHEWLRKQWTANPLFGLINELLRAVHTLAVFALAASSLVLYFTLWFHYKPGPQSLGITAPDAGLIWLLTIAFFCFSMMVNSGYLSVVRSQKRRTDSLIPRILRTKLGTRMRMHLVRTRIGHWISAWVDPTGLPLLVQDLIARRGQLQGGAGSAGQDDRLP